MPSSPIVIRAHDAAVRHSRAGYVSRWRACWAAAVVVGQRKPGLTRALAADLCRSVDTVESMARAAVTYAELHRHFRDIPEASARLRALRRALPWSHWAAIGRLMRAHDLTPLDALSALDTASAEGLSVAELSAHVTDSALSESDEETRQDDYRRALASLLRAIARVLSAADRVGGELGDDDRRVIDLLAQVSAEITRCRLPDARSARPEIAPAAPAR